MNCIIGYLAIDI